MHMTQTRSSLSPETTSQKTTQLTSSPATSCCSTAAILSKVPPEANLKHYHPSRGERGDTSTLQLGPPSVSTREDNMSQEERFLCSVPPGMWGLSIWYRFGWRGRAAGWQTESGHDPCLHRRRAEAQGGECPADWEPQTWKPPRYACPRVRSTLFSLVCWQLRTSGVASQQREIHACPPPKKYIKLKLTITIKTTL